MHSDGLIRRPLQRFQCYTQKRGVILKRGSGLGTRLHFDTLVATRRQILMIIKYSCVHGNIISFHIMHAVYCKECVCYSPTGHLEIVTSFPSEDSWRECLDKICAASLPRAALRYGLLHYEVVGYNTLLDTTARSTIRELKFNVKGEGGREGGSTCTLLLPCSRLFMHRRC
jgi:hypothetical protein